MRILEELEPVQGPRRNCSKGCKQAVRVCFAIDGQIAVIFLLLRFTIWLASRMTLNGTGGLLKVPLWIENHEHSSDIVFPVVHSETGATVHEAYGATPDIAAQAVDSAQKAFLSWRNTKPWYRRELLLKAADYLRQKRGEVADVLKVSPSLRGASSQQRFHGARLTKEPARSTRP